MFTVVVQRRKSSGDTGLYRHVILRGKGEDSKSTLEAAKDPFNVVLP